MNYPSKQQRLTNSNKMSDKPIHSVRALPRQIRNSFEVRMLRQFSPARKLAPRGAILKLLRRNNKNTRPPFASSASSISNRAKSAITSTASSFSRPKPRRCSHRHLRSTYNHVRQCLETRVTGARLCQTEHPPVGSDGRWEDILMRCIANL